MTQQLLSSASTYQAVAKQVDALDADCATCAINVQNGNPAVGKRLSPRKAYPGFANCWAHMSRAMRALSKNTSGFVVAQRYGFYTRQVYDSIKLLRNQAELNGEADRLYDRNIDEELALARLLLAGWLQQHNQDTDIPLPDLLNCIKLISQVAELAQKIAKQEESRGELTPEMLDAIVTAVTHAFHKANLKITPVERAALFSSEIANLFAGTSDTIDSQTVPVSGTPN